jgi:2-methylaconitate cis-trans-isomerase PrpF
MKKISCTIIRGGTSKGIFLERDDIPPAGPERDKLIMAIFGSPDPRQIDGLGGADKLTSKTAVMGPPTRKDCDIDYLFGQVGTSMARIDWTSNCGNISSGAALYAIEKGYVKSKEDKVKVLIHQANTGRRLIATVPLVDGRSATEGDFRIGGVPGTGGRIDLDFQDFAGCILKKSILPTGHPVDKFLVPDIGKLDVSIVDMANLCLFVRAADVGMDDERGIVDLQNDKDVVARLEKIRAAVSAEIGFIKGDTAAEDLMVKVNPLLFVVGRPRSYQTLIGNTVEGKDFDLFARSITRAQFSKAYPGTGSIGTAVSCGIKGTVSSEMLLEGPPPMGKPYKVRVGHPGGILQVSAWLEIAKGGDIKANSAVVGRTASLLMEGTAYVR